MQVTWTSRVSECDGYGICGVFASCSSLSSSICTCLKEFEPKTIQEWNNNNRTGGCVRRTPLQCERVNNKTTSTKEDGLLKLQMVKVPDFAGGVAVAPDICRSLCLQNGSCVAYSHDAGIACISWTRNLLDIQQLESGGLDLYGRVAHVEPDRGRNKTIIIAIVVIIGTLVIVLCAYIIWRRTSNKSGGMSKGNNSDDMIGGLSEVRNYYYLILKSLRLPQTTSICPTNLDRVVLVPYIRENCKMVRK